MSQARTSVERPSRGSPSPRAVAASDYIPPVSAEVDARCSCGALHRISMLPDEERGKVSTIAQLRDELGVTQHDLFHLSEYALQLESIVTQRDEEIRVLQKRRKELKSDVESFDEVNKTLQQKIKTLQDSKKQLEIEVRESRNVAFSAHEELQQKIAIQGKELQETKRMLQVEREHVAQLKEKMRQIRDDAAQERQEQQQQQQEKRRSRSPAATVAAAGKDASEERRDALASNGSPSMSTRAFNNNAWELFSRHLSSENAALQKLLVQKDEIIDQLRVKHCIVASPRAATSTDDAAASNLVHKNRLSQQQKTQRGVGDAPSSTHFDANNQSDCLVAAAGAPRGRPGRVGQESQNRSASRSTSPSASVELLPNHSTSASWALYARGVEHDPTILERDNQSIKESARVLYEVVRQLRNMLVGQLPLVDIQTNNHPIACEIWNATNVILSRIGASLETPMPDECRNIANIQKIFPRCLPGGERNVPPGGPGGLSGTRIPGSLSRTASRSPSAAHPNPTTTQSRHPSENARLSSHQDGAAATSVSSNNAPVTGTASRQHPEANVIALEKKIEALRRERKRFEEQNQSLTMQLYSGGLVVTKPKATTATASNLLQHPPHSTSLPSRPRKSSPQ